MSLSIEPKLIISHFSLNLSPKSPGIFFHMQQDENFQTSKLNKLSLKDEKMILMCNVGL